MIRLMILVMAAGVTPAQAHDVSAVTGAWTYDPWVVTPLYGLAILYLVGTWRLGSRTVLGHGIGLRRRAAFWGGWTALAAALVSPLHWLGERLFTAHMAEHALIVTVATPLLAGARPVAALLWALPRSGRTRVARLMRHPAITEGWAFVSLPVVATAVHGVTLWLWHLPSLYDLTVTDLAVHRLQHLSFTVTGLVFWWSLLCTGRDGQAVLCLFASSLHTGLLGLILMAAGHPLYPQQTLLASEFGFTPLEDQELAGLVMWVPMGAVYAVAALWCAAHWIAGSRPDAVPLQCEVMKEALAGSRPEPSLAAASRVDEVPIGDLLRNYP